MPNDALAHAPTLCALWYRELGLCAAGEMPRIALGVGASLASAAPAGSRAS